MPVMDLEKELERMRNKPHYRVDEDGYRGHLYDDPEKAIMAGTELALATGAQVEVDVCDNISGKNPRCICEIQPSGLQLLTYLGAKLISCYPPGGVADKAALKDMLR